MASDPRYLQLDNVVKVYRDQTAVAGISLDVAEGEFLTLLGPSGSGKSTTLNMIAGFTEPTDGSIVLAGRHVETLPAHKRNIGVVFQDYALFPHMTVAENVAFPLRQRKLPRSTIHAKTREVLDLVHLRDYANRYPSQLSGGQRQRVAVARAVVFDPRLLLMDEPLGALDRALRERLQVEIRRLHRELGVTVVYVTHDQSEAFALSDRIAVCNGGRLEQVGSAEELYQKPTTLFVARFLGESNVFEGEVVLDGAEPVVRHAETRLRVDARPSLPTGRAAVVVRPESTRVRSASDAEGVAHDNAVVGRVRELRYFGSERKVWIDTDGGVSVVAAYRANERVEVVPGDRVIVTWPTAAGTLLPIGPVADLQGEPTETPATAPVEVAS